jgi:enoyl-CoA hydratase/carnithine racemase
VSYRYLNIHEDAGVVFCTMRNPPRHTLVAPELAELQRLVGDLRARDDVRVLVFTGAAPDVFIAHYEVGELADSSERQQSARHEAEDARQEAEDARQEAEDARQEAEDARQEAEDARQEAAREDAGGELHGFHRFLLDLQSAPFVTIAAINGNAAGGGFEFALGCDFRLQKAGDHRLGLPETNVGIIPGAGGTQRYARLLGTARALDLILHGRLLDPDEALTLGLVHRVLPAASFDAEVAAFARTLAGRAPVALAAAKRAIYAGSETPLEQGLRIEQRQFDRCMQTRDAAVALRGVLDGTPWEWQGR